MMIVMIKSIGIPEFARSFVRINNENFVLNIREKLCIGSDCSFWSKLAIKIAF